MYIRLFIVSQTRYQRRRPLSFVMLLWRWRCMYTQLASEEGDWGLGTEAVRGLPLNSLAVD